MWNKIKKFFSREDKSADIDYTAYYLDKVKQVMTRRRLRTVSFSNYAKLNNQERIDYLPQVHSVKLNPFSNKIECYGYGARGGCNHSPLTISETDAKNVWLTTKTIINNEDSIPSEKLKNILVIISR